MVLSESRKGMKQNYFCLVFLLLQSKTMNKQCYKQNSQAHAFIINYVINLHGSDHKTT